MNWELILEYIKILVWPFLIFVSVCKLKNEIKGLVNRIASVELPGDIKLNLPPKQETPTKDIPKEEIKKSIGIKKEEIKKETPIAQSVDGLQQQISVLLSQIAALQTALVFERIYQAIFGSQIKLLEELRMRGVYGAFYEDIAAYYQQTRIKWSTLNSYPFDNYLNYLINSGLIETFFEEEKKKVKITALGVDFLGYIEKLNYLKDKSL